MGTVRATAVSRKRQHNPKRPSLPDKHHPSHVGLLQCHSRTNLESDALSRQSKSPYNVSSRIPILPREPGWPNTPRRVSKTRTSTIRSPSSPPRFTLHVRQQQACFIITVHFLRMASETASACAAPRTLCTRKMFAPRSDAAQHAPTVPQSLRLGSDSDVNCSRQVGS